MLYILAGLVLLIFLINQVRLRLYVRFGEELQVWATIGPKTVQVIPKPPARPKKEKPRKEKPKPAEAEKPKKERPKLTFSQLRSALPAVWESLQRALRATGKRVRIDPLYLDVVFGDPDPCDAAEKYGAACSVMWAVMPRLEELVQLPDPEIHLNVDFNAQWTVARGEFAVGFRIGDFAAIGLSAVPPLLKWFLALRKEQKRTASEPKTAPESGDGSEEKIA